MGKRAEFQVKMGASPHFHLKFANILLRIEQLPHPIKGMAGAAPAILISNDRFNRFYELTISLLTRPTWVVGQDLAEIVGAADKPGRIGCGVR
jgi:hypothetical protein